MPLIESGRIKVYSTDSIAGRAWISRKHSAEYCSLLQNRFDQLVYQEIVPLIPKDCASADIEIITAGASIGAFNAVATICRHPDVFRLAIAMSGTYDLSKYLEGRFIQDFYFASPLHFLPGLEGPILEQLRKRLVLLPSGEGDFEDIGESWRMGNALGAKRVAAGSFDDKKVSILSTEGMLNHAHDSKAKNFGVATETGILYKMGQQNPDKTFIPASEKAECQYMKMITLKKVYDALVQEKNEVIVPKEIADKARLAIERMLAIS